jgi:hypothetical protein
MSTSGIGPHHRVGVEVDDELQAPGFGDLLDGRPKPDDKGALDVALSADELRLGLLDEALHVDAELLQLPRLLGPCLVAQDSPVSCSLCSCNCSALVGDHGPE